MKYFLIFMMWFLLVFGALLFMKGASYKDNVSRDPKYYDKD